MIWPALIAHADWGADARKRQVAVARLPRGTDDVHASYVVESLAPATDGRRFFGQLGAAADPGQAMIGFDFPIGLPRVYAAAAGIKSFPGWLEALGTPPWESFHLVAAQPDEITLYRPFYPMRPGGTRREHLHLALRLSARDLRRRCEGNDAEALFWTLGGKQVGKGALTGWQLISAARRANSLSVLTGRSRLALCGRSNDCKGPMQGDFRHHLRGPKTGAPSSSTHAAASAAGVR